MKILKLVPSLEIEEEKYTISVIYLIVIIQFLVQLSKIIYLQFIHLDDGKILILLKN